MQRPRSTALGTRISSGMLLATLTSVFARCALRFGRWHAPRWSHGACIALAQSCISGWNGRDSLQLGCRTSQRTRPELLEQRGASENAVTGALERIRAPLSLWEYRLERQGTFLSRA